MLNKILVESVNKYSSRDEAMKQRLISAWTSDPASSQFRRLKHMVLTFIGSGEGLSTDANTVWESVPTGKITRQDRKLQKGESYS